MEIDINKIGLFLKTIHDAEYIYMRHCMDMRDGITNLINRYKLSKEDFCKRFNISLVKYDDYVSGNYNYSVQDMAYLSAAFIEFEKKNIKDKATFKVDSHECPE